MELEKKKLEVFSLLSTRMLWLIGGLMLLIGVLVFFGKPTESLEKIAEGIGLILLAMLAGPTVGKALGKSGE